MSIHLPHPLLGIFLFPPVPSTVKSIGRDTKKRRRCPFSTFPLLSLLLENFGFLGGEEEEEGSSREDLARRFVEKKEKRRKEKTALIPRRFPVNNALPVCVSVSDRGVKERTEVERFHARSGRVFTIVRRDGMYECPSCRNLYKWKKSMLSHLRNQCKQPPRFECPHCTMKNYQKSHMIRHLRVHHPQLSQTFWDRKLNGFFRL